MRHTLARVRPARVFVWLWCLVLSSSAGTAGANMLLRWTAPGDDGQLGRATAYDLRFAQVPITPENYWGMPRLTPPISPALPGRPDSLRLYLQHNGMPWYFAMRTRDEAGNWSKMSNLAVFSAWLDAGPEQPVAASFAAPAPNPARSSVRLAWEQPAETAAEFHVHDVSGRIVHSMPSQSRPAGRYSLSWDLIDERGSRVAPGTYFVRAAIGQSHWVRRVVVVR